MMRASAIAGMAWSTIVVWAVSTLRRTSQADHPGSDGESRDAGERGEQSARDAEAPEHRGSRTPVGIERQSAAE